MYQARADVTPIIQAHVYYLFLAHLPVPAEPNILWTPVGREEFDLQLLSFMMTKNKYGIRSAQWLYQYHNKAILHSSKVCNTRHHQRGPWSFFPKLCSTDGGNDVQRTAEGWGSWTA